MIAKPGGTALAITVGSSRAFSTPWEPRGARTITVVDALAFAQARPHTQQHWHVARLGAIKGFACYVHALDPDAAEVIPARLIIAKATRRIPYLYSDGQIAMLMSRCTDLFPPLMAASMHALIGLMAATGVRSGEAVALDLDHFCPDPSVMRVTGKYARVRLIPLHESTVEALATYQRVRATLTAEAPVGPLLVGTRGRRLNVTTARAAFRAIADGCDLPTRPGCTPPRLHDLRHTFAVNTLIDAHRQGADVDARIAALATYLGHVDPANTYWYLSASPELMALVSDRMTAYKPGRRT